MIVATDESPMVADCLATTIGNMDGIDPDRVAAVSPPSLDAIVRCAPSLVVLDPIQVAPLKEMASQLRLDCPGVRLVTYASRPSVNLARYCHECGVCAFLPRFMDQASFLRAIRVVCNGGSFIHKTYGPQVMGRRATDESFFLSDREERVLRLSARGYSNREIGEASGLSPKTIDTYRARGMRKLGISRKPELMDIAAIRGWVG